MLMEFLDDRNCQLIKINAEFVEALKRRGMEKFNDFFCLNEI